MSLLKIASESGSLDDVSKVFHTNWAHLQLQTSTRLANFKLKNDIGLKKIKELWDMSKLISRTQNSNDFQKISCSHEKNPGKHRAQIHDKTLWDQRRSLQATSAKIRKFIATVHVRKLFWNRYSTMQKHSMKHTLSIARTWFCRITNIHYFSHSTSGALVHLWVHSSQFPVPYMLCLCLFPHDVFRSAWRFNIKKYMEK